MIRHWNSGDILKNVFKLLMEAKDGLLKMELGLNGEKLDRKTLMNNIRKLDEARVTQNTQAQTLYLQMLLAKQQDQEYEDFVQRKGSLDRQREWAKENYKKWAQDDKNKDLVVKDWSEAVQFGRRYQVWSKVSLTALWYACFIS
jgi:hypothetical protein